MPHLTRFASVPVILALGAFGSCSCDDDGDGSESTSQVGGFDGLFDDFATGMNFPLDIGIVPDDPDTEDDIEGGDIYVADYGTSQVMYVADPTGEAGVGAAESFFDGTSEGFAGTTAISIPHHEVVWVAFEQGGTNDAGGLVALSPTGEVLQVLDGADDPAAFANPGGLCFGEWWPDDDRAWLFLVNLGDGTAWRIDASDRVGTDATFVQVGGGLATGTPGNPGTPGNGLTSSKNLPDGGARGCAYADGALYVADAQNARVVRFDRADEDGDIDGIALEDTPPELITYPTDLTINDAGDLIVISYDNAHAFVSLELPTGGFLDNGLHDLNVNAGNYGTAVARDTIWFTRANNSNGALRAITPDQDTTPSTQGPFPAQ